MLPASTLKSSLIQRNLIALRYGKGLSTQATTLKPGYLNSTNTDNALPYKELPGPTKYELIRGFMPGGPYYKKSFSDYMSKARQQYGDIYRIPGMLGKTDVVMVFNVDDVRTVYRTEGIWPDRPFMESIRYYRKKYQAKLYEKVEGLANSSGKEWANFRAAVNPVLMQPRNAKSYVIPMQDLNSQFIERIREIRDPNTLEVPENFLEEINRLTFESVAVVALNRPLGLIRQNRERADAKKLFISLNTFLQLMYDLDFKPSLWKYVWTPTFARYKKALDTIYDTTRGLIDESLAELEVEINSNKLDRELSVFEKLSKIDKSFAIVMAVDLLFAGVDTTSSVLSGILLEIAKNTDKQEKLRNEIRKFLPEKNSTFTVASMKNLPYLRACIKEGIRMHPTGPGIPRGTGEDTILGGYHIPKGTRVTLNFNLFLREDKYFPRPNEFIPERWVRGGPLENTVTPFTYLPFGFGPRMCVGKRIVDLELEVTVARLVRNFQIEFNYSIENAFKSHFINTPAIPLKFKFTEVEN